jgi:hypothetical protein
MSFIAEIYTGVLMLAIGVGLTWLYFGYLRRSSDNRRSRMLRRIGLDRQKIEAVDAEVRSRCLKCPSEALCERWLAGEASGNNAFCPNASTFSRLKNA